MRVLVVDDEAGIRELLVRWLAAGNYETAVAGDVTSALDVAAAGNVGVAFVDLQLPGGGGASLIAQLRALNPSIAIILATADDKAPPTLSLRHGVTGYLVKPFSQPTVLDAVATARQWHEDHLSASSADRQANPIEEWLASVKGLGSSTGGRPHDG